MNRYEAEITRADRSIDHVTVDADTLVDAATIARDGIPECDSITAVVMTSQP